jgi:hypothetical protein
MTTVANGTTFPTFAQAIASLPARGGEVIITAPESIPAIIVPAPIKLIIIPSFLGIQGTIEFRGIAGLVLEGGGPAGGSNTGGTEFHWEGNPGDPLMRLNGVRNSSLSNFSISSNIHTPLYAGIEIPQTTYGTTTSNFFRNICMDGTSGGLQYGVRIGSGTGGGQTDTQNFEGVSINNYGLTAWSIEYSQSKAHTFRECNCSANGYGEYGVATGLAGSGGSFYWHGGGLGNNTISDFFLGEPCDVIEINGGQFEGSPRALICLNPTSGAWPVTMRNMRWAGNNLAADGQAVIYQHRGPFNFEGNYFGDATNGALPTQIVLNNSAPGLCLGNATGNTIESSLLMPFTGNGVWSLRGNNQRGAGGVLNNIPNQ